MFLPFIVNAQNNSVLNNPQNLSQYRNNKGTTYTIKLTGTDQGSVWGGADGYYTDDSRIGKAVVHAGLLKIGQEGLVKVTILPGQPKYTGSTKNGITTNNYGSFLGSYKFESVSPDAGSQSTSIINNPQNLSQYRKNTGTTYTIKLTGTDQGSVWGGTDGFYTDDSRIGKAVVHAGLLKIGQEGLVKVTILPGQSKYTGSTKNGITTNNYGPFMGSYKFESVLPNAGSQSTSIIDNPQNLSQYRKNTGTTYTIKVTGTDQGSVWGGADGYYTDDSRIGKAVVHAGLLKVGQEGLVKVTILQGQPKYIGSTKNGITTNNYGSFLGSYKFEK
ncbi:MAG: hypothetical protein A2275_05925 [Bacteroidetes bacterium RIFOXYA12_FULL_35_11]|nr:MAG: hypothetical protein A2X01_20155 [Bacteroidetes bacterium GWF2_35_48]OFY75500.1 MAG: hypothetical protein A2275_05925 [Bacteroidetes bacterium RIFOXYA12_FULL_35_11]